MDYYFLDPAWTDPKRIQKERDRARELRKTHWWHQQTQKGVCAYCGAQVGSKQLTMDHIVPLARGGRSIKGNLAASCRDCNQKKSLQTPAEQRLAGSESAV